MKKFVFYSHDNYNLINVSLVIYNCLIKLLVLPYNMNWLSYLEKKLIFNDKKDISAAKTSIFHFKNLQVYACVGAWVLIEEYL